jgi:nitrogen fixation-related uncharacterized protein
MESLMVLLLVAVGFFVLGLASLAWGVDSRETGIDGRRR